jgi:hypothetical protein
MANLLETGSQWLSDQIDKHLSSPVRYRRGSSSVLVQAGKGRTTFDLPSSNGMIVETESRDFLITASKLLDSAQQLPLVGDRIIEEVDGELRAYEVQNFGTERPYRFCDSHRIKLRVHTKYVGVVLA